ncbi:unnamed protein product [Acanthoscelides obtectus]|uniref:Uncharacterized protein n=1 Tax=Acanthoscelides obtectus TaxID=200917 RepID=A0A9P0JKT4_ACAOB|nr:unnamed protein product [Acanthoscelides obtectus]CAK1657967.1 hypothetical protein AOBTE_LOCUS20630 [Acanthoscelides obtectus]
MAPQYLQATLKHGGGSVIVWGCFAGNRAGDLVRIEGIMRKEQNLEILENHAVPSGQRIVRNNFEFQQDNDPEHSSRLCRNYLEQQQELGAMKITTWPS